MTESLKKQFCVIGDPIGQSLSPQIHGEVFRQLGLDFEYTAVRVAPESLSDFIAEAKRESRPGFNVTIPHKQAILPLLDNLDPLSSRVGAVNTVVNKQSILFGYNTDVQGCIFSLKYAHWKPKDIVIVLGAGGAARAAVEALVHLETKKVCISDVFIDRAFKIQSHFEQVYPKLEIYVSTIDSPDFNKFIQRANLLINATPVGMWPNVDSIPIDPSRFPKEAIIFDMVPKPVRTLLIRQSEILGMKTIPGIRMLIAQALESDSFYLNRDIPISLYQTIETSLAVYLEEHAIP